jgi:hypothetical protein
VLRSTFLQANHALHAIIHPGRQIKLRDEQCASAWGDSQLGLLHQTITHDASA